MKLAIHPVDLAIMLLYLVGVVGLGCWAGIRQRREHGGDRDYFLASGTLKWPMIGLSLFSTNISTIHGQLGPVRL